MRKDGLRKNISQFIKQKIVKLSGLYFYNVKKLPVGTHLQYFLKYRTNCTFKTVFDVGANIGQTAIYFHRYFPTSSIYCFEPFSTTFYELHANTRNITKIKLFQIGLGDCNVNISVPVLPVSKSVANTLIANESLETTSHELITVETIDGFLATHPEIEAIDLLKIDTEGYDLKVLLGANKAIASKRIKMIYTEVGLSKKNHKHVNICEMVEHLERLDFIFLGLFSIDLRHSFWDSHFGNALFIHKTFIDVLKVN